MCLPFLLLLKIEFLATIVALHFTPVIKSVWSAEFRSSVALKLASFLFLELDYFQEVGGEGSSAGGSLADLRELERKDENLCCSACAIM